MDRGNVVKNIQGIQHYDNVVDVIKDLTRNHYLEKASDLEFKDTAIRDLVIAV